MHLRDIIYLIYFIKVQEATIAKPCAALHETRYNGYNVSEIVWGIMRLICAHLVSMLSAALLHLHLLI